MICACLSSLTTQDLFLKDLLVIFLVSRIARGVQQVFPMTERSSIQTQVGAFFSMQDCAACLRHHCAAQDPNSHSILLLTVSEINMTFSTLLLKTTTPK